MQLSPNISKLVRAYRESESDDRRGPRFKEVALALEEEMRKAGVSEDLLLECFGPPNLWTKQGNCGLLVYFFDHEEAGRDADEWYFHLAEGNVTSSGHNRRGINDLSGMQSGRDWRRD